VHRLLKGADLAGFNLPFDLTVLSAEFARARHGFHLTGPGPVVLAVHLEVQRPDAQRPAGVLGQAERQPAEPMSAMAFLDVQLVHEGVPPLNSRL
jgi:hypothetical protein